LLTGAVVLPGCGGRNFDDLLFSGGGGLCGLILLVLDVLALVSLLQSSASTGSKLLWGALIFFLPLVGLIIWYFFGPKKP
jgi:hypothetical protein